MSRRQDNSAVVLHEDSVRRVAQCRCGASMVYRGPEKLWAAGWGSRVVDGVRKWECDACWSPPAAPATAPIYRADPAMLEVAALPRGAQRERLGRQMVRLLEQDPPRGRAYLEAIVEHVRALRSSSAMRWRALHELVAAGALSGGKRPRRRPAKPGKALPEQRRVAGEVASEVVAVRLTPSEKRQGEELAKGMALGLWLRRLLQLAADGVLRPAAPAPTGERTPGEVVGDAMDAAEAALGAVLVALRALPLEAPTLSGDPWKGEQVARWTDADQTRAVERSMDLFGEASALHTVAWGNGTHAQKEVLARLASVAELRDPASVNGARRRTVRSTTTATVDRRAPAVAPSRARQR